jgi:hypothetical protein
MNTHEQYSWNLGIQRQITQSLFASATYVGSHIIHVWNAVELNPAVYEPGTCAAGDFGLKAAGPCTQASNVNQRRILNLANPTALPLGNITQYDDGGTQGYNGLLLNAAWRLHNGLSLNGNYTWSHCVGLFSTLGVLNPGANYIHSGFGANLPGSNNRDADVGNCIQDRRQVANITLVYQTPKYSSKMARILVSGWTVASTIPLRSGQPLTMVTGTFPDPATGFGGNSPGSQRPNQILPNVYSTTQLQPCSAVNCLQWLNPKAFGPVPLGTFGNMGVTDVFGPAFWQWDLALSREFRITEGQRVELRGEAFNVTNSLRPGNPGVNVGATSTFGLITTDATPPPGVTNPGGLGGSSTNAPARVMQFALKYVF